MGLSNSSVALLLAARARRPGWGRVATLGRQRFQPTEDFLQTVLDKTEMRMVAREVMALVGTNGSKFVRLLGASCVEEIDASDYEGASILHDMNQPLPDELKGRYDVVFDGGCLEHIFDVPQAFRNMAGLLKLGGTLAIVTCANNLMGHGFYQFSPELFYRYFREANGWKETRVFLCEHLASPPRFWKVQDPAVAKRRVELFNGPQMYLMVLSTKTAEVSSAAIPQQSDYAMQWRAPEPSAKPAKSPDQEAEQKIAPQRRTCLETVMSDLKNKLGKKSRQKPRRFQINSDAIVELSLDELLGYGRIK